MTNNNITDFIDAEYIDYLDTIKTEDLVKSKASIYANLIQKTSPIIFEYIFNKLPIDQNYFLTSVLTLSYSQKKVTSNAIDFFHSKLDLTEKLENNDFYENILRRYDFELAKYIYDKYRLGKVENPIPPSLSKSVSVDKFSDYRTFKWIKEVTLQKLTIQNKYCIVNNILSKNIFNKYGRGSELNLTVKYFSDLLKQEEITPNEYINCLLKERSYTLFYNIFNECDTEFIKWIFDIIGFDKKDFFNENLYQKLLNNTISSCIRKPKIGIEKIKIMVEYGAMLGFSIDTYCLDKDTNYVLNCKGLSKEDYNHELIQEIIKLGICPKKHSMFYDYYKQISIIN